MDREGFDTGIGPIAHVGRKISVRHQTRQVSGPDVVKSARLSCHLSLPLARKV